MKDMNSHKSNYSGLAAISALHLPVMYEVMFTMVYSLNEVFHNLNTLYMAGETIEFVLTLPSRSKKLLRLLS